VYSLTPVRAPLASGWFAHRPLDIDDEPVRAPRQSALRTRNLVAATDIEIVHEMAVLDVEAVA
jgi:hypothetical protein